jgi:lathosterol oxidase
MNSRVGLALCYTSAFLGVMAIFAVFAFHFPEYLATRLLRAVYDETQVRLVLRLGMLVAVLCSVGGMFLSDARRYAVLGLVFTILAWLSGGPNVALDGPVETARFYLSLNWVLLDLLLTVTLFITMERFSLLRPNQPVLRSGWKIDLAHYVVNHLLNGGIVYLIFIPASAIQGLLGWQNAGRMLADLPVMVQVLLIMVVSDFAQYWVHRASHRWRLLWRFHRVHHSVDVMDWPAG